MIEYTPASDSILLLLLSHSFESFSHQHLLMVSHWILSDSKSSQIFRTLLSILAITRFGRLAEIWWSICISKSQRSYCISFSRTDSMLCIYHLFLRSNFNFLHNSQWITLPTRSCLLLYSFCANSLHSLIMWLIISSLSLHRLHLLFFFLVGGASGLFLLWHSPYSVILSINLKRFSFSLKISFLNHVQIFSFEISLVCRLKCLHSCFSSYFYFLAIFILLILVLSVLFPVTIISLPLNFLCSLRVFVSMHRRYLQW